jgi:hypothetical protein
MDVQPVKEISSSHLCNFDLHMIVDMRADVKKNGTGKNYEDSVFILFR